MKTTIRTLSTITSALLLAAFVFALLPTAAMATGSHKFSLDKEWVKKDRIETRWSKKHDSKKHGSKKHGSKKHGSKKHASKNYGSKKHDSKKNSSGKKCAKKKECDNSLSIPLYIKGDKRVGKVTVRLVGGDLKIQYQVDDGWYIQQTNLDVADSYNGLHVKLDGSPDVEAFPYSSKHFTPVKSVDYTISASQWALGTELYIAAQAVVVNKSNGKCQKHTAKGSHGKSQEDVDYTKSVQKDAWALGEKFPGQMLAGYFTYKLESCDSVELGTIQFSDAIYTVNEGDVEAVITVIRSGNTEQAASVEFTTMDGSAVNGADYDFANGVLNFAAGQTSAQFSVMPIDDAEVETVETVSLQLSNPLGATLGQQNTATLEIEDNDVVAVSVIAIDRIEPNPVEENTSVIIYVTRTGNLSVDATVDYGTIDVTAIGGTQCGAPTTPFDYQHVGGTLFFNAGVAELAVEVTTCNNNPRGDATETFDFEIYNPVGAELSDDGDGNPNSNIETITILETS
jgi:hypothetical protein